MNAQKGSINWSKFGLSSERNVSERTKLKDTDLEEGYYGGEGEELFANEKVRNLTFYI